ncbi:cuticle protein 5-like [Homalodisca vitripennis]|nr:cuticle protein 5-like [Homalodisca vitripennis]KAG8328257.1 hypothetical protein J6590_000915 [Homalodisca vitripennis]
MKVLVVFVAVACLAQSALSSWAGYYPGAHGGYHGGYAPTGGYHGPLAAPVVTPSGFLADTPEVAAAKAAHFSEVAKASGAAAAGPAHGYAGAGYAGGYAGAGYAGAYHGPLARPVVTPSGFLADTPEVAAAKAAHLSLVHGAGHGAWAGAGAGAWAGAGHGAWDDGSYHGEGAWNGHDDASHYDDGSYKPHLYEHGHY